MALLRKSAAHAVLVVPLATGALTSTARADTYAPWLEQIGITQSLMSAAGSGKGQLLGIVDTGIAPSSVFVNGQLATTLSACAAVTFRCGQGYIDDHGHGTAVASIAAANRVANVSFRSGTYHVAAGSYLGAAPNANLVATKVLNTNGVGYSADVANGIKLAADAGAGVINVSITFGNSADIVSALNYAAGKGAFIVWAGGNDAQALLGGANTHGLTPEAVRHLILAGSVSAANVVSDFSNQPGSGSITTARTKTGYAARWVVTPGEGIVAPLVTAGTNAFSSWTGTSMSAPLVAGSLMLLQATWPILKTNGTTADLLLATATDLGVRGTDATYGRGLINLQTAFQPVGGLAVLQANGNRIAITSLTGAMITSGALGSLQSVQGKLASYTAFDGFTRNFSLDLASLIHSPLSAPRLNPLPTTVNSGPTVLTLRDGSEISYVIDDSMHGGYSAWTGPTNHTLAVGLGVSGQYAYAQALYGRREVAQLATQVPLGLTSLATGGPLLTYGADIGESTRMALAWSRSAASVATPAPSAPRWSTTNADNLSIGFMHQWSGRFATGMAFDTLTERHGLLGTTYDADAALSFGRSNTTHGFGLSAVLDLSSSSRLLASAEVASTQAGTAGIFAGTSTIRARAYGLTWLSTQLFGGDDTLAITVQGPLRVFAGHALVLIPSVDPNTGVPSFVREHAALAPTGHEIDYTVAYSRELGRQRSWGAQISWQRDALNVRGRTDHSAGLVWTQRF